MRGKGGEILPWAPQSRYMFRQEGQYILRFVSTTFTKMFDTVELTFREKQEVVDEGLHVFLHGGTRRRRDLVVFGSDRSWWHLVQALVNDAQRLTELLHAAQVYND
jgi:hypothetical protein